MSAVPYAIYTGEGNELSNGIQSRTVAMQKAQDWANERGESVFVTGPGIDVDADDDEDIGLEVEPEEDDDDCSANYIVLQNNHWGADGAVDEVEHLNACERMQEWLNEHAPENAVIDVMPCPRGQIEGLYREDSPGNRWLVRSGSEPKIEELVGEAWEHAVQTWV